MGIARSENLTVREYLRVSRDSGGRGKSPDQQHEENLAAFARLGWTAHPADPYRDTDRSASAFATREREAFTKLVADLEADSFGADVLAIWESSRGSRQVGEWDQLLQLCKSRGVRIWVTTHGRLYDPANSRDRRSVLEDAVDAEYESAKNAERIQRDVRAAAKEGRPHGKALYGYQRIYRQGRAGPELEAVVPHPDQAPIVQEAASSVLAGETFYAISKDFNSRGIPPRRPSFKAQRAHLGWTPTAVRQMLTMPAYAGKRTHKGEIVSEGQWPALIDYGTWEKLQVIMSPPGRKRANDWPAKHLLTGIAVCGVCGAGTRIGKQNLGRRKDRDGNPIPKPVDEHGDEMPYPFYHSYVCVGAPGKTGFHVAMRKEHLDSAVTKLVLLRLEQPDVLALIGQRDDGADTDAERRAILDKIAGHQAYLEEVHARAAERQDLSLLFDQEDRVKPLIAALQRRLESLAEVDPYVIQLIAAGGVREAWAKLEIPDKRRVIRALITPRILPVGKNHTGRRGINHERIDAVWR